MIVIEIVKHSGKLGKIVILLHRDQLHFSVHTYT